MGPQYDITPGKYVIQLHNLAIDSRSFSLYHSFSKSGPRKKMFEIKNFNPEGLKFLTLLLVLPHLIISALNPLSLSATWAYLHFSFRKIPCVSQDMHIKTCCLKKSYLKEKNTGSKTKN